jgi:hypothetical protein
MSEKDSEFTQNDKTVSATLYILFHGKFNQLICYNTYLTSVISFIRLLRHWSSRMQIKSGTRSLP